MTLLFLHGWPNSGTIWSALADELTARRPEIDGQAPTLPGFGHEPPLSGGYACDALANFVREEIDWLLPEPVVLVGHSMGGKIAQLVAARAPKNLAGLVLIAPVPLVATPTPPEQKAAQTKAFGDRERLAALISAMESPPLPSPMLDSLVEMGFACSRDAFVGWIETMRDEDFSGLLAEISVPTLVLHGERDPLRTEATIWRDVVDRIPGADFSILPAVGHLPHVIAPGMLAETLVAWLRGKHLA